MEIITTALPYANGPLHLGHMVEKIQADIYARSKRFSGQSIVFVSGDDAHGVAIMLSAEKEGADPADYVKRIHAAHVADLARFQISLDQYSSTHSPYNQTISTGVYEAICKKGWCVKREIEHPYDSAKQMFLADRYVKGTCPKCGAVDQYGDGCEPCGAVYQSKELISPTSALSQQPLEWRSSTHAFFVLEKARGHLQHWLDTAIMLPAVKNKLKEWFGQELKPWDISRDAPYFGFPVPDLPSQYFYVWLDAPCGYLASLAYWLEAHGFGRDWVDAWQSSRITHFIGKDILYHHGLFWPAMCQARGIKSPDELCSHGFLRINSEKMSKSRGTFIQAKDFPASIPTDFMRYYIAAKLGVGISDIDFNWPDFAQRVNADLVGKLVNLGSRLSRLLEKNCQCRMGQLVDHTARLTYMFEQQESIFQLYSEKNYQQALRLIMSLTDQANQWISETKPWDLAKQGQHQEMSGVLTAGLNIYRWLMHMISPICPDLSARALAQFGQKPGYDHAKVLIQDVDILPFKPLASRVVLNEDGTPHG